MQVAISALQKNIGCIERMSLPTEIDNQELSQLLILIALKRDKQAFTSLFTFFAPKIKRISTAKFNNAEQASEVVQETMSNIWRKAHLFNVDKGNATTWVYTIMRNVTFDMLRKKKSNKEDNLSDDIWPIAEGEFIEGEAFDDHLSKNNILACLDELPDNQKMVVKGFYFLEMSQEQLAQHLDLPLGTIKSRLRLALEKLKLKIGDNND